jgi:hypothetical protein
MTLIYIAYIILAEARSFRNALIRLVTNIRDLLSGEAIEFPLKKSLVELDLVSMLISAMKIYGTLLAPYGLMLLLMLFRVFREKTLHDYDFAVLLSFFAITVLLPITGYDAFRIMNMINLLLPIVILEFIYSFNKTRGSKSFIVVMFILIFSIVGLASMVFIQFTPQGFKTLSLNVPIYFGDENSVIAEYISSVEYPVLRPRAHIVTLSYLAGHLEERTSRIIGDRVFCTGFMYVNRRDLYTSCVSISEVLGIYIKGNQITKYEFKIQGTAIVIINYPVIFITEEPIEYRCNILRRAVVLEAVVIFNSGTTIIGIRLG